MKKKITQALISVSNKNNLKTVLSILKKFKIKIISSGGTFKVIKKLGFNCLEVSDFTKTNEILEGRVKTLHPKVHAGILNKRKNKIHKKDMKNNNFENIDLVITNFYPFEKTVETNKNHENIIENIDIGGPALTRAAAKNYNDVVIVSSIDQYQELINELKKNHGSTTINFREKLSNDAFNETAYYDSIIANYFNRKNKNFFSKKKTIYGKLVETLRYGENPHQKAAIYSMINKLNITQLHGKKLSYNNYNDIFSAINVAKTLPNNLGTIVVKHSNPCGVSINKNKFKSFKEAISCDPISAFGGIICCNFKVNKKLAVELNKIFLEVIIANGFEMDALKILKKKKNTRIIDIKNFVYDNDNNIISNFKSILIQSTDNKIFLKKDFRIVSKKKPNEKMLKDLIFAFNICRNVKSNAIVLAKDEATIGIGSGQPSRIDSCKIAIKKMNKFKKFNMKSNIVAASDAFFPFADGIETLVQGGISGVVQPSGSVRDKEIIRFANQTGTVLLFSKSRHFKH